ncbi:MAG: hemolysin family protein [Planctomycetota bacterium]
MDVALLITFLLIAIGFSFFCSIAEAVLLSITPSFIAELKAKSGGKTNRIVRLKQNIDRPLSAILSLNTVAHTVGAAGVGAQATKVFEGKHMGITSAVLTLLILIFSEIIPKTLGAMHWRKLANITALSVDLLIIPMSPLVWFSEFLTRMLSSGEKESIVTRAEIQAIAELGSQEGLLDDTESGILKNVLQLDSIKVEDVMTPRPVVIALDQDQTLEASMEEIISSPVSRIVLFQERRDNVTGFALRSDLLLAAASDERQSAIAEHKREIVTVFESERIKDTLEKMLKTRSHISLVTDQFGGMEGIVTMEDIIETILAIEIIDEQDKYEDMRQAARQQWSERLKRQGITVPEPTLEDKTDSEG